MLNLYNNMYVRGEAFVCYWHERRHHEQLCSKTDYARKTYTRRFPYLRPPAFYFKVAQWIRHLTTRTNPGASIFFRRYKKSKALKTAKSVIIKHGQTCRYFPNSQFFFLTFKPDKKVALHSSFEQLLSAKKSVIISLRQ